VMDDAEIEALRIESSETIDLVRFVDDAEIDPIYFATPYFIAPDGKIATETFAVIMAALRDAHKAGIGRVVLSTREHPVVLAPRRRGMLLMTLRSSEEVRDDSAIFDDLDDVKVDKEMVEMARRIIEQKSGPFDAKELTGDRYQAALRELVARKIHGEKPVSPKSAARPTNVVNLMDALKRSLAADEGKGPAPSRKAPRRAEPQRRAGGTRRRRAAK
jgi:DNA end-binding protein Ku